MNKKMTREEYQMILACGDNYIPEQIQGSNFYFFKGYLIQLLENGGYILYNKVIYNSAGKKDNTTLKNAMADIVKRKLADFDREEKAEKLVRERIMKNLLPVMEKEIAIIAEYLK